ncbi:MAG: hypothetical protein QOF33_4087 [Thermomicrobiales bacterium]|jgi:hypothetical protein|nr:hypothetical protein [Thermomicrobiales bacterium]MEA2586002.1 hypothetical protein [Thermomicrobiales bacterium]MEA2594615.1 hypothetical protein [Thermomicrobiales bacterium]
MSGPTPDEAPGIKLFTVAEANALLPQVTPILLRLRDLKGELDVAKTELNRFTPAMRSNGHGMAALALERQIAEVIARISVGIQEITELGIEIKDLDQGLIDFPSVRDRRIVYLCWRLGEGEIAYWHDLDTGFAGREPI